jgi:hypothetical protein
VSRDGDAVDESEFGLGPGMIDPTSRADRAIEGYQELQEIYSRPKTFGGLGTPRLPEETPVPRLLPGESELDRE